MQVHKHAQPGICNHSALIHGRAGHQVVSSVASLSLSPWLIVHEMRETFGSPGQKKARRPDELLLKLVASVLSPKKRSRWSMGMPPACVAPDRTWSAAEQELHDAIVISASKRKSIEPSKYRTPSPSFRHVDGVKRGAAWPTPRSQDKSFDSAIQVNSRCACLKQSNICYDEYLATNLFMDLSPCPGAVKQIGSSYRS